MSGWSSFCHWHPLSIIYLCAITLLPSVFAPRVGCGCDLLISG